MDDLAGAGRPLDLVDRRRAPIDIDLLDLRTCANTLGCWLPGEVPEPDQGLDAVAQQLDAWALVDLG